MAAPKLSPDQSAILDAAIKGGSFRSETQAQRIKCRSLNGKGLIRRDPKDGDLWYPAETAKPAGPAPEPIADVPAVVSQPQMDAPRRTGSVEIVSMLVTAARLFDEGDIQKARVIADGAYDLSQAEARFAAKYAATRALVPKFRQLQGDALLMETRCRMELARAYDAAQQAGTAARKGRPKNVATDDIFKQADAGLTRQEIHEARKLVQAEERSPGIAERAIAARVAAGLAPTRANLKAAIGTKTATKEERGDNLYETPAEAVHALLALEEFGRNIWEPACGKGAISGVLEQWGHHVTLSDLRDYGTADRDGECQEVADFLTSAARDWTDDEGAAIHCPDIITNPPYGEVLNAFVAHALRVHRPAKMALLLNLNFLAGFADDDRNFVMDELPPARVYVFKRRLPMMHRDGWDGPKASSSMNTGWFIWERQADGSYGNATLMRRIDWKDFQPAAESEAA